MKIESRRSMILRTLGWAGIVGVVVIGIVVGLGWYLGWTGLGDYGFALILAGIGVSVVGGIGALAPPTVGGKILYESAYFLVRSTTLEQVRRDVKEESSKAPFLITLFVAGFMVIVLGLLLTELDGSPAPNW